jgi:hypothetical protein
MSEIQVSTSELRSGSQNLSSAANEIGGVKNQIGGIPASVGNAYDGQLRQVLQGILGGGVQIGAHLQSRSIELGDELLSRAMGFEAANEAVKGSVLGASTAYVNFVSTTKKFSFLSFLGVSRSKALSIWGISGLAGFMSLFFVKTQPEILTPFPEAGTFDQHSEATQSSKPNSQKTGFGILMEEYEQKRQASENENSNKPVPIEESESPTTQYDTYYDVPIKSQGTAYGSAACLPTSISMVMDYYKTQNANNNTASPDDLIKMLDNAINQAIREIDTRFDFKNTGSKIELEGEKILIEADTEERAKAALDVVKDKMIKRGVSLKHLDAGAPFLSGKIYKIAAPLKEGISTENAKKIAKFIRDEGPKSIKTQIQGDELRVTSKSRDDLQETMAMIKDGGWEFAVQFTNFR